MKVFYLVLCVCVLLASFLWAGVYTGEESSYVTQVVAAESLVPTGRDADYNPDGYGSCEFVETVNNVIQFFIKMSALIAVLVFMYAGFIMVSSRGDSALIEGAKKLFANVLIGFVILLTAFLIINTIIGILVGGAVGGLTWQTIECQYANESAPAAEIAIELQEYDAAKLYEYAPDGTAINYRNVAVGGSCSPITSGPCSVANLRAEGLFSGNEEHASRVCNKESGGTSMWSGTDLCRDGNSFSGGWFQINVIAHANRIPGCSGAFTLHGSGGQGGCLERTTNSAGTSYCAVWNCSVTNADRYNDCREAVEDWGVNSTIANELYRASGNDFTDWRISAGLCQAPY